MRVHNLAIVLALAWAPAAALAQEDEEDEFYQDPDTESEEGEAEGADVEVRAEVEEEEEQLPFRGSSIIYENALSAVAPSVDLSPEASFYYAMSYAIRPRYYVRDWFSLRLGLALEQELTDSDSTTQRREPLLSDLTLDFYFQDLLDDVSEVFDFETYLRLGFPTSKGSQARTMIMAGTLGASVSYTAPVLEGLRLAYGIGVTKYLNQYTSATQVAPTVSCTPGSSIDCDSQINLGTRNPSWLLRNSVSLVFTPIEDLSLSIGVTFSDYFLYDVAEATTEDLPVDVVCSEPDGCPIEEDPMNTNRRSSILYSIELSYSPLSWLGLALGTSTANPQLTPDSEYRAPFFNRFTMVYFDMSLSIDQLVLSIRDRRNARSAASRASRPVDEV